MTYCKQLEHVGISPEGAQIIIKTFLYYYLSTEQYSMTDCIEYTGNWLNQNRRDLLEEYELAKPRLDITDFLAVLDKR